VAAISLLSVGLELVIGAVVGALTQPISVVPEARQ
jgi:hypothetical protein